MHFLLTSAIGLVIIASFAGWGWFVYTLLRLTTTPGILAATGMAFATCVGAVLNQFGWISLTVVRSFVLVGFCLFLVLLVRAFSMVSAPLSASLACIRSRPLCAALFLLFVAVTAVKYFSIISPGTFHLQDDYHAYFVFPVHMLQTGSIGADPFSERRLVSSLGGKYFLDTITISLTGSLKNLRLMDEGVAFLILLLLLAERMAKKKIPAPWLLLTLTAVSLFAAPVSNITSVYGGVVIIWCIFEQLASADSPSRISSILLLGLLLASLTTLKTTFAPVAGSLFLGYFALQLRAKYTPWQYLSRLALCGSFSLLLLAPWMRYSQETTGTLLYPLFGKGMHGSQYGIYLLPTAHMGLHNVLAFINGFSNTVGLMLFVEICLIAIAFARSPRLLTLEWILIFNLVLDMAIIGVATGGVQMFRYSFAILFATAVFLLVQQLSQSADGGYFQMSANPYPVVIVQAVLVGMFLGTAWHGFTEELRLYRFNALQFGWSNVEIDSPAEVASYQELQQALPAGQPVLVRLDKNYLFDFRRNPIYINDLPGGASLPPGLPCFQGSEPVADYLLKHGIRYLAYSYGDEATFSRTIFGDRLKPNVNVWLRQGARIAFDFQDNAYQLGESRKKLYDNGEMFLIDLEQRNSSPLRKPVEQLTSIRAAAAF